MPSFRSAKKQAAHAIKQKLNLNEQLHGNSNDMKIHSLGTARNYTQALTRLTEWLQANKLGDLKGLTTETAHGYLELRGQSVGQKLLDQERQAIQLHLDIKLPMLKSELAQVLKSRAYTSEQVNFIKSAQTVKHRLSTEIACAAGLRAHELLTLQRATFRQRSVHRIWSALRFTGRKGELYTVIGKGGLVREVLIPKALAQQLESLRLETYRTAQDRGIYYKKYYDIGGGQAWTSSFSKASLRKFNWSHGAHGLRHSYAQIRMNELQQQGLVYAKALETVSQELGHFRPEITEVYLR